MNETVTQLGIGGIFVLLVLRELLPWLLKATKDAPVAASHTNGKAGEISVAAWEVKFNQMFEDNRSKLYAKMDTQHQEKMRALERLERALEREADRGR